MAYSKFNQKQDSQIIWERIKEAEKCAKKHLKDTENAVDLYMLRHYGDRNKRSYIPRLQVPYCVHVVETIVAAVTANEPKLDLIPRNEDGKKNKKSALAALTYEFTEADLLPEFRSAVKDLLLYGYAVIYDGWLYDDGKMRTETNRPREADLPAQGTIPVPMVEPLTGLPMVDPLTGLPAAPLIGEVVADYLAPATRSYGQPEDYEEPIDRFFARRISPKQFFISPEATIRYQDTRYLGYWEYVPLEELKDNAAYNQKVVKKVKGSTQTLDSYRDKDSFYSEDCLRVKVYHYFEKRRKLYCVYAEGCDEPLLVQQWGWKHGRYPFHCLHNIGDDDKFYGKPLLLLIEDTQRELNEIRSAASLHRKLAIPKTFVRNIATTPKQDADLMNPIPFGFVDLLPGQEIQFAQPTPLPADHYRMDQWAKGDMQILSGQDQYEFLSPSSVRKTTVEVAAIQQGGGARALDLTRSYERMITGLAEDCLDLCMQYSEVTSRTLAFLNTNREPISFGPYTAKDIRGNYHFRVVAGSTAANFNSERLQSLTYFQRTAGELAAQAKPLQTMGVDAKAILQATVRHIPELADFADEIFPPPPDPAEMGAMFNRLPMELLQPQPALPPAGMDPTQLAGLETFPATEPTLEEVLSQLPPEL